MLIHPDDPQKKLSTFGVCIFFTSQGPTDAKTRGIPQRQCLVDDQGHQRIRLGGDSVLGASGKWLSLHSFWLVFLSYRRGPHHFQLSKSDLTPNSSSEFSCPTFQHFTKLLTQPSQTPRNRKPITLRMRQAAQIHSHLSKARCMKRDATATRVRARAPKNALCWNRSAASLDLLNIIWT